MPEDNGGAGAPNTNGGGGGGGGGAGGGGGGGGGGNELISYARFKEVVDEKNDLRQQLATAKAEAKQFSERAATADTLATQLEQTRSELTAKTAQWDEERGLFAAGVTDPDDAFALRQFHGRLPEKDRPKLIDWWADAKKDVSKLPRALQHLVEPPPVEQPAGGGAGPDANKRRSGVANTRTGMRQEGAQNAGDPLTAAKIAEIRAECVRTGNWEPWKTIRDSAYASGQS